MTIPATRVPAFSAGKQFKESASRLITSVSAVRAGVTVKSENKFSWLGSKVINGNVQTSRLSLRTETQETC